MKNRNTTPFRSAWLTLLALLMTSGLFAQDSFGGTVVYNIRVSGKMADEYLKNDPPKTMTMHLLDNDFIVKLSGGRIARTFLYLADSNHTFIVDIPNERYFRRTYYSDTNNVTPVAMPTGESKRVKGRDAMEYKTERPDRGETIYYYVHDDYRVDTTLFDGLDGAKADFLVPGLGGRIPLWKTIKTPQMTTTVELASIKKEKFPKEAFSIPEGFSNKQKRDPRK